MSHQVLIGPMSISNMCILPTQKFYRRAASDDKIACRELVAQNLMVLEKMAKHTTIKATSSLAGTQFSRYGCTA